MEYGGDNANHIIMLLDDIAKKNHYDKIVLKLPKGACVAFQDNGYVCEAKIPKYYCGGETCCFLSKFLSEERSQTNNFLECETIISAAKLKSETTLNPLSTHYSIVKMDELKTHEMADLYKAVFKTYPFPIFDPSYILSTMKTHVIYFGVYYMGELVALSSSEVNGALKNAEMTDFAVKPSHRGRQLSKHLLVKMEKQMSAMGIKTLYTIARAKSMPMNCTFSALGYIFGGTLINNTQISGQIESMNVWFKTKLD